MIDPRIMPHMKMNLIVYYLQSSEEIARGHMRLGMRSNRLRRSFTEG
jgi:hypothetical protein